MPGTTRIDKLHRLIDTLGFDEALKIAPTLKDDDDGSNSGDAATRDAARAAAHAAEIQRASSTNPFARGKNFSLTEQARLYSNEKTRKLAISLAKSQGITLPENPTARDLRAKL